MSGNEADIAFGDQGAATAALLAMSQQTNDELFPGSSLFVAKLTEENKKRPPSHPLVTREQYENFIERMEIFSITDLCTLSVPEPEGFMNAVLAAQPPCECFASISFMSRKVFVKIVRDFQIASIVGAPLPPGGFGMVGTGSAGGGSSSGPSSSISNAGTSSDSGGKITAPFGAYDLDGIFRTSMSDKTSAAKSFSCLRAIWRLSDKEKISKYQSGGFMIYDPTVMMALWRNNLMQSLGDSVSLPACWSSARVFSQVSSMPVFTDMSKLDRFLRMKFSSQDMDALSLPDFHPGGVSSWKITDAVSVTPGAKVFFRECVEGLVTVFGVVHSELYEVARASLISGLSAYSYNAMSYPDAVVLFNYHNALVKFASIITTEEGSAARQLSGPEHTVKVLIECFAHLAKDKWASSDRNFTEFNNNVYPVITWPRGKSATDSPGKRTHAGGSIDGGDVAPTVAKKPKKTSTYDERETKRRLKGSSGAVTVSQGQTTAASLSLSGLSLGGGAVSVGGNQTHKERLCVATLCHFAGVKYKNQVVKCNRLGGCGYTHPGNVDEVLKGDAAIAIGRLKSTAKDSETIAYMTAAEDFYAARAT